MNKEDSGERKERTVTRLFSISCQGNLPGYKYDVPWILSLVPKPQHHKRYLSMQINTISTCTVCQTKKERRFTASFRRKKCHEGAETNFK